MADNEQATPKSAEMETQYLISINKFVILAILSMGLYTFWWSYKEWRFFKEKENTNILPAVRALFGIVFLISLFTKILAYAKENNYQKSYSSVFLFLGYISVSFLAYLPDPFWLLAFAYFLFFIPAFSAINFAKRNDETIIVVEQEKYNVRQVVLLIVGGVWWTFILLGLMLNFSQQSEYINY